MHRRILLAGLPALALARVAAAHGDVAGPNGGKIGEVGGTHIELVARDNELHLYVLDAQDKPVTARGATGSAIVQAGGRTQTLRFEPAAGDSHLVARGEFPANGARIVASVAIGGQPSRQARFAFD